MFKPATTGPKKAITANRLDDGLVVFLDADGGWSVDIAAARLFDEGADFDEALTYGQAQHDARVVVEPYAIDVEVDGSVPVPVRLREKIRADRGPTIPYGDAERAKLRAGEAEETRRTAGPTV